MTYQKKIELHGKAWLALNEWVTAILGEERLAELDDHFNGEEFYPRTVIEEARVRMNEEWPGSAATKA